MTKIISRIFGGIGNQLFCYATARRLSLVNGAELVIDNVSGFVRDFDYQRKYQLDHFNIFSRKTTKWERKEPFSRFRFMMMRYYYKHKNIENRSFIQQENIDFDSRILTLKPKRTVYLEGYWQSEKYFKDIENTIREDLRIIPPGDVCNLGIARQINNSNSVAVHVRFFDKPNEVGINNASSIYYKSAVEKLDVLVPNAHFFLFSDEPFAARSRIPLPDDRITIVTHNHGDENAYADLWLMTQCKHFIIANSTFSWWGAWLASFQGKIIISPSKYTVSPKKITAWDFEGLIPKEWITL